MTKKRQSKKVEEEVQTWRQRLTRMRRWQKANSETWSRNEKLLFGTQKGAGAKDFNEISYAWGLVKGLETNIYVQNPDVMCVARKKEWAPASKLVTKICKYDLDAMGIKGVGNQILTDCFVFGYGAISEYVTTEKGYAEPDEGKEPEEVPVQQTFKACRIFPRDILFDPNGTLLDLSDHSYIAVAYYPTVGEIRRDPSFKVPENLDNFPECSQTTRGEGGQHSIERVEMDRMDAREGEQDPNYRQICVWEIYDKLGERLIYMTDHNEEWLGEQPWPVELEWEGRSFFPITLMAFHKRPRGFYPIPEIDLIAPQLEEMNALERIMRQDSITKWRKWAVLGDIIPKQDQAKITDTTLANAVIEVDPTKLEEIVGTGNMAGIDLKRVLVPLDDISMPRDLPVRQQQLEYEIQHILGYGPSQRGGLPSTRSAREAIMLNDRQIAKLQKRLDEVQDFYRSFLTKHVMFLQQKMALPRAARIVDNAEGLTTWLEYGSGDIEGAFDFDVLSGSSGPKNTETKRSQELMLFQTLMPFVQGMGMDPRPLIYRLAEVYEWDDVDDLFQNLRGELKNLALALAGFKYGNVGPEQILEQAAKTVQAGLTPADLQALQQMIAGKIGATNMPSASPKGMRGDPNAMKTSSGDI